MNIRAAMAALAAVQGALSITAPKAERVRKAWQYFPPQSTILPELPAWTNTWTLTGLDRHLSMRVQRYTINSQLFVARADGPPQDESADIASAFMDAFVTAMDANVTLSGTVTQAAQRGGDPTLAILVRGGLDFVGLNLFVDVEMKEAAAFS